MTTDVNWNHYEPDFLMLGLDAAGKTTLLYRLKLGVHALTLPTIGFNKETIRYKGIKMTVWDVGGDGKIRARWKNYFSNKQGLIFVVDASNIDRIDETRDELHKLLEEDELKNAVLLVYANKQDLSDAVKPQEFASRLELNTITHRPWHVQGACATHGDGLYHRVCLGVWCKCVQRMRLWWTFGGMEDKRIESARPLDV